MILLLGAFSYIQKSNAQYDKVIYVNIPWKQNFKLKFIFCYFKMSF